MLAIKKFAQSKAVVLHSVALLFVLPFLSCGKNEDEQDNSHLGKVTFYNESSYYINVYYNSFSGSMLVEMLKSGDEASITISPSDNYGFGSVFSIEYLRLIIDAGDQTYSSGDVWVSCIDPNMQIQRNIEAGKNHNIQIANPLSLEIYDTFVSISNKSNNSIEFNYLSSYYRQAGNGESLVPSGKIGVYKINSSRGEKEIKGHTITQVFEDYPFPEFIANNGYIYDFEFNGSSVVQLNEGRKIFF